MNKKQIIIFLTVVITLFLYSSFLWEADLVEEKLQPIQNSSSFDKIKETYGLPNQRQISSETEYHWDHMPVSYNLDSCENTFEGRMKKDVIHALDYISSETSRAITFRQAKIGEEADITFVCDIGGIETNRKRFDVNFATEAEALPYIYEETLIYAPSKVYIYATYDCLGKRPILIIHEVLHLFNLDHNINPSYSNDIMHPLVSPDCNRIILEKDINYLKEIYLDNSSK